MIEWIHTGEIVSSDAFSAGITLRFPRVTALRSISDKTASEVENEYQLWIIYQETLSSRSDAVTGITLTSPSGLGSGAPDILCRFLTEEQLGEFKKKKTKSRKKSVTPKVNVADCGGEVETKRLSGMTIVVLEGTYLLDDSFIYDDEVRADGWLETARKVKSREDLQKFIKKHSGKVRVAVDGTSLVVGGRKDDARVVSHVRATNNARVEVDSWKGKAPKTARARLVERMAEQKGVLRWTYLFSLVYGSRSAEPKFMDYLVFAAPSGDPTANSLVVNVCSEEIQSTKYLQRVLAALCESDSKKSKVQAWQDQARQQLDPTERWIVASRYQTLWPYQRSPTVAKRSEVFYLPPDVGRLSDEDFQFQTSSSSAGTIYDSVLPLIRVMGARTSFDLTTEVTYVICDLVEGCDVAFTDDLNPGIFPDINLGQVLLDRLAYFCKHHAKSDIRLISPDMIRKRKWCIVTQD